MDVSEWKPLTSDANGKQISLSSSLYAVTMFTELSRFSLKYSIFHKLDDGTMGFATHKTTDGATGSATVGYVHKL